MKKRTICVVTGSRSEFGILRSVLQAIDKYRTVWVLGPMRSEESVPALLG